MPSYSQAIWSLVLCQSQNVIDVSFYYITQCPQGIVAMIGRRWKPATATKLEPAMDLIMLSFLFAPDILFPSCHFHFGLLCHKMPQFPKGKKNRQTDFSLMYVCWSGDNSEFQKSILKLSTLSSWVIMVEPFVLSVSVTQRVTGDPRKHVHRVSNER